MTQAVHQPFFFGLAALVERKVVSIVNVQKCLEMMELGCLGLADTGWDWIGLA